MQVIYVCYPNCMMMVVVVVVVVDDEYDSMLTMKNDLVW